MTMGTKHASGAPGGAANPQSGPWQATVELLRAEVESFQFNTWFQPLRLVSDEGGRLVLAARDQFTQSLIRARYLLLIQNAAQFSYGREMAVEVLSESELARDRPREAEADPSALNPRYTFDSFVVGASNRFAHAASLAVAESPADAYNPLFLYGGAGLGKTHLMHAIGHFVKRRSPGSKLLYITCESFTNQMIAAIRKEANQEFRDKLRCEDVLLIDDIQFLAGKPGTQEEFFHTFNELHGGGRQIVIASDRPPREIPTLEERLRSRFEWGLIADLQRPDLETRVAILQKKAENEGIDAPDEVLHLIAERVETNIRELEGALTRIHAKAELEGREVSLPLAESELKLIGKGGAAPARVGPEEILAAVAEHYGIPVAALPSPKRNREYALPRQAAMYLMREFTALSTPRIGEAFGGRDHTTVLYALSKIAELAETDPRLRVALEEIRAKLRKK